MRESDTPNLVASMAGASSGVGFAGSCCCARAGAASPRITAMKARARIQHYDGWKGLGAWGLGLGAWDLRLEHAQLQFCCVGHAIFRPWRIPDDLDLRVRDALDRLRFIPDLHRQ